MQSPVFCEEIFTRVFTKCEETCFDILLALKGKDFGSNGKAITLLVRASDSITAPFDPQALRNAPPLILL